MPNEVLFHAKSTLSREDIAELFERVIIHNLREGERINMTVGSEARVAGEGIVTLHPPARLTLETTVDRERSPDGPETKSLQFKLIWDERG